MSTNSNPQYGNGMNVVFPTLVPHRNDDHPDATVAYVVFIHGLFGHPWKTWADEAVSGPRKPFWPGDLLPHSVKNIRIYTFGYDADIEGFMSPASQNSVQAHGANLLQDLHSIMRGRRETSVPFIFIAHSLGGLVLKEALNQSSTSKNRDLKSVAESTHGIIFLGTPHRGSDAASYGKIAFTLAKVFAARSPNTQLLRALERSSEVLERIAQSFYQTWDCHPEMQVHSFHEEKDVARLGGMLRMRVVPPECARIGHVNEILGSIPADHQYMAKFKNSSDTGFVRIRNVLNLWVSEFQDHFQAATTKDYKDCLASLDVPEARARVQQVSQHHKNSFEWLWTDQVPFIRWLADAQGELSPIFWITGKPGSGKSTLMRFAMQDPRLLTNSPQGEGEPISYFFHMRGQNIVQKSLHGMLHELVYQLLLQVPTYFDLVRPHYHSLVKGARSSTPQWDTERLKASLLSLPRVLCPMSRPRFILFVDALDENENADQNNELLSLVKDLAALFEMRVQSPHSSVLKICLASRPWAIFQRELGSDPRIPHFAIHEFTTQDIEAYTRYHLRSAIINTSDLSRQIIERLVHTVVSKARGVFIWVRIVVQQLCEVLTDGGSWTELEKHLNGLPEELQDLYKHTMSRISPKYALEALVACRILLSSLAPITVDLLHTATLACINGPSVGADAETWGWSSDKLAWLKSRTGGLIETVNAAVDDGSAPDSLDPLVQFVHQTAHEYVRSGLAGLEPTSFPAFWLDLPGSYLMCTALSFDVSLVRKHLERGWTEIDQYLHDLDEILDDMDPPSETILAAVKTHLSQLRLGTALRTPTLGLRIQYYQQGRGNHLFQHFRGFQPDTGIFENILHRIDNNLYSPIFWPPSWEGTSLGIGHVRTLLLAAVLGLRFGPSKRTDRPRMVKWLLKFFKRGTLLEAFSHPGPWYSPDLVDILLPDVRGRTCYQQLRPALLENLATFLVAADDQIQTTVDEESRIRILRLLCHSGIHLCTIPFVDGHGVTRYMLMADFMLVTKGRTAGKWLELLQSKNQEIADGNWRTNIGKHFVRQCFYRELQGERSRHPVSPTALVVPGLAMASVVQPCSANALEYNRFEYNEGSLLIREAEIGNDNQHPAIVLNRYIHIFSSTAAKKDLELLSLRPAQEGAGPSALSQSSPYSSCQ